MRQCAFLTMDSLEKFQCYDNLLYEPLRRVGWQVTPVSWRSANVDWNDYEVVLIRSTWDYQDDPQQFLDLLETIERSSARLENSLRLVRWNISKTYLQDLEQKGIRIVPSLFGNSFNHEIGCAFFDFFDTREIVIKPVISANADDTFRLKPDDPCLDELGKVFSDKEYLVQPFMRDIIEEGEFSLFFFGGRYSHAILKTPKKDDFRVQEEHGGQLRLVQPEPLLLEMAEQTMAALEPLPLYGRVDFVRDDGKFYVMELELIEPSLYFNMDPASTDRFAHAFTTWMNCNPNSTRS
ncbi:MAG: hypothetical protein WBB19_11320 [Desulforhopalus sp.]